MSLLEVSDLSHSFGDKALYRQSSFSLYKGEHMGVVGQNGTGKSTLIRILIGEVIPDTGSVVWQKNIGIGHLDQYAGVDGSLTIREYLRAAFSELYDAEERLNQLYARLRGDGDRLLLRQIEDCQEYLIKNDFYAIDTLIGKVATGLGLTGIGMDRKLSELSGGQREKAILAKLLLSKPDVLLLDEPTNFLDAEHIEWLSSYLADLKTSFMVVSHDHAFLDRITNCICDIENCRLKNTTADIRILSRRKIKGEKLISGAITPRKTRSRRLNGIYKKTKSGRRPLRWQGVAKRSWTKSSGLPAHSVRKTADRFFGDPAQQHKASYRNRAGGRVFLRASAEAEFQDGGRVKSLP
jgi:ATPase subunit of ABC transporter with duplicated ATPase domains